MFGIEKCIQKTIILMFITAKEHYLRLFDVCKFEIDDFLKSGTFYFRRKGSEKESGNERKKRKAKREITIHSLYTFSVYIEKD